MRLAIRWWCVVAVVVVMGAAGWVRGDGPGAGSKEYVDGLEALGAGRWDAAVGSFSKAIDADEENADYYRGRGVAESLGEKPDKGKADLARALKLRPNDEETRMWLACAVTMTGDLQHQSDAAPYAKFQDEYFNTIRRVTGEYGQAGFREQSDRRNGYSSPDEARQIEQLRAGARAKFPQLAKMYVDKVESTSPELAGMLRERAVAQMKGGNVAEAARALARIKAANPDDPQTLFDHGSAVLEAGGPAVARRELTLFLVAEPKRADAYLLRAKAAAMMGDEKRAKADLETARGFDAGAAEKARPEVEKLIKENANPVASGEWSKMVDGLKEEAKKESVEQLRGPAGKLVRAGNDGRLIADEAYQDRLLALLRKVWEKPGDAGAYADVGDFLYRNALDPRGEKVGPRDEFRTYRTMTERSQGRELAQAQWCAEEALKRDPKNVHGMAVKAAVLVQRGQWNDADALLRQALEIKGDDPRVLLVMADVLDHAASVQAASAANLRQTKTWSDMAYIYTRWPSASDLAAANGLEQQANQLWGLAHDQIARAAEARKGTAEGYYLTAMLARRDGDENKAIGALEEAVKLEPGKIEYHDLLGTVYGEVGQVDRAFREKFTAANLAQTTAGPLLRLAWAQIPMTKFATARKLLEGAMATDPGDPRGAAYMAVVAEAKGDQEGNLAWTRVGQAVEEAQLAFDGPAAAVPASGEDVALAVALGLRAGDVLAKEGKGEEAAGAYSEAIGQFGRVEQGQWWPRVARAMLPSPETEYGRVPEARPLAEYAALAYLGRGRVREGENKLPEARKDLEVAARFWTQRPPTVDTGVGLEKIAGEAWVELVGVAFKEGGAGEARQVIEEANRNGGARPEMMAKYRELTGRDYGEEQTEAQQAAGRVSPGGYWPNPAGQQQQQQQQKQEQQQQQQQQQWQQWLQRKRAREGWGR